MKVLSKSLAAMVAAATLVGGGAFAVAGTAYAADNDAITVTPNPWYANSFDGWGTSLAWFANATGSLGEESAITTNLGDDASKAKAVEYGKQLREQFYQSIFGDEGLDLNMARYNVGGGNASDVAYGYPFMRQVRCRGRAELRDRLRGHEREVQGLRREAWPRCSGR